MHLLSPPAIIEVMSADRYLNGFLYRNLCQATAANCFSPRLLATHYQS